MHQWNPTTKFILKISISTILIIMSIRTTFYNECKNIDLTLWMLTHFSISLVKVEVHWLQTKLKCTMQTSSSVQVRAMSYLVITTRLNIRVPLPPFYSYQDRDGGIVFVVVSRVWTPSSGTLAAAGKNARRWTRKEMRLEWRFPYIYRNYNMLGVY